MLNDIERREMNKAEQTCKTCNLRACQGFRDKHGRCPEGMIGNPNRWGNLNSSIQQAKQELKHTVPHRRGIILGYQLVNLDSLMKDGIITNDERRQAHNELQLYYSLIL